MYWRQPFKGKDWTNYIGVHKRNIEMYILDEDSYGNVYVRYLRANTRKQDEWVEWDGVLH